MSDRDEGALERAEGLFKRVLGRIGSTVDNRLVASQGASTAQLAGSLAAEIEAKLEGAVRLDSKGVRRQAPDEFCVLLTYEQHNGLADAHRQTLASELAATAYEYIANHRYEALSRVRVSIECDLFAAKPNVTASFSASPGDAGGAVHEVRPVSSGEVRAQRGGEIALVLTGANGKPVHRFELSPGGEPVTVGRAAGNRLRIEHDSVSKFHATLRAMRDGSIGLADLGSTNGTFINDEAVAISTSRPVDGGDTVSFGDVAFEVSRP